MDLFGKTDDDQLAVTTTRWVIHDLIINVGEIAYNPDFEQIKDSAYEEKPIPKLSQLNKFLAKKEFLHGDITYVDFILFEILEIVNSMKKEALEPFENLREYHQRFAEQKWMKDYMASEKYIRRPFYGPAVWNPTD